MGSAGAVEEDWADVEMNVWEGWSGGEEEENDGEEL